MSSRFAFSVYDTVGLKRDLQQSNFKVYKGGLVDTTILVHNNNDGTYYFTVPESDKYAVKINDISQDELSDIFIASDDIITQSLIDPNTLVFDGGALAVKSGVFAGFDHNHEDVYSDVDHVHVTGGPDLDFIFDANEDNALTLAERSALSDDILSLDLSLAQNIANLSMAVMNLQATLSEEEGINYRQIASYVNHADGAPGDTSADNKIAKTWTETSTSYIKKYATGFIKRPGDSNVVVTFTAQMSAGTGDVQVKTGAGAGLSGSAEIAVTDSTQFQITIDISAESNLAHEIAINIKSDIVTDTLTVQLVAIEIT